MARTPRTVRVALSGESDIAGGKPIPWLLAAVGGAVAVAAAGWALVVGMSIAGWLGSPGSGLGAPLRLGTGFWLLANGGSVQIGQIQLTILPLGLTCVIMFMIQGASGYAAQQAREAGQLSRQVIWQLVGWFTITYLGCVVLAAFATNQANNLVRMIVVSTAMAAFPSLSICLRIAGVDSRRSWPVWARSIPKAAKAAALTVMIGSGTALVTALILASNRVIDLHDSLNPGLIGSLLLLIVQLAYLPNFLAWCASWVLGAGFSIGEGSIISPSLTEVGLLPNIPALAAVPTPGPGSWPMLWWLITGVIAGALASLVIVRARPRARFDETALVGGLSGVVSGVLIVGVCAMSNGGMGSGRLDSIGARMPELVVIAPSLLGVSGLLVGAILGLLWKRQLRQPRTHSATEGSAPDMGEKSATGSWLARKKEATSSSPVPGQSSESTKTAGRRKLTRRPDEPDGSTRLSRILRVLRPSTPTDPGAAQELEEKTQPVTPDDQGTEPTTRVRAQE